MEMFKWVHKEEGAYKSVTYTWLIPNFHELICNTKITEITAVYVSKFSASQPRLKLKVLGHNRDLFELHGFFILPGLINGILDLGAEPEHNNNKVETKFDFKLAKGNQWQHITTFYKADINKTYDNLLTADKHLMLRLQMKVAKCEHVKKLLNKNELTSDLNNTLNTGLFADAIIKSKEGNEFKVHKVMIASRSDVFKAQFQHGTIESRTNIIESKFESNVLKVLLSYIYTDKVPRLTGLAVKLLAAADYYELNGLKRICEEELKKQLTAKNANEMFELADSLQAASLKESAAKVIKCLLWCNHVSPEWRIEYYTFDCDE